jgi:hypothetical protein
MATCGDGTTDVGHPGNDYYVNDITGTIQRGKSFLTGPFPNRAGWQGPFTWCQAKDFAAGHTGSGIVHSPGTVVADVFHGINFGNWILRIGEIILGVVLIGVGIAKLTGTDNVVGKVASSAGKLAFV